MNLKAKFVVVSMYADCEEIQRFETVGIDGYFTKITPSDKLVSSLCQIIEGEKVIDTSYEKKKSNHNDAFHLKHKLTKRELDILRFVKLGKTSEQIANELAISYYTVETHRKNINSKLNFTTKQEFHEFLSKIDN